MKNARIKTVIFQNLASILAFSTNICPNKVDLSGNTVWPQFSKCILSKLTILGIFDDILSTQIVNVARNVEWDFLSDFQTLWFGFHQPKYGWNFLVAQNLLEDDLMQ